MRRDIGNELIVAIAAVAVLAFALVFGIVLSLSSSSGVSDGTPTVPFVNSNVAAATETVVAAVETEPEQTAQAATEDASETPTETVSPAVTEAVLTETEADPLETATSTAPATATDRPRVTAVLPTQVVQAVITPLTSTPETAATDLPDPATKTQAPTNTPKPTNTETAAATATPVPLLSTQAGGTLVFAQPTQAATVAQVTLTPRPTVAVVFGTPTVGTVSCAARADWVTYTVAPNDTIETLARATGSSVDEIRAGNCLAPERFVQAGDVVLLPRLPVQMLLPGEAIVPGVLYIEGCTLPTVQITQPVISAVLQGEVAVEGSADNPGGFGGYRLELFGENGTDADVFAEASTPVDAGLLATLEADALPAGQYWIRLVVLDADGVPVLGGTCAIPVRIN